MLNKVNLEENFKIFMTKEDSSKLTIKESNLEKEIVTYFQSMENILVTLKDKFFIDSIYCYEWDVKRVEDRGIRIAHVDHSIRILFNHIVDFVNDNPSQLDVFEEIFDISTIMLEDIKHALANRDYTQF